LLVVITTTARLAGSRNTALPPVPAMVGSVRVESPDGIFISHHR
jgi:hypothetical protein